MDHARERTMIAALLALMSVVAVPAAHAARPRELAYVELEGTPEQFR